MYTMKAQIKLGMCSEKSQGNLFFFKIREKSENSVKWSGKFGNLQKSGKSQGILKSYFNPNCSNPSKIEQTDMR